MLTLISSKDVAAAAAIRGVVNMAAYGPDPGPWAPGARGLLRTLIPSRLAFLFRRKVWFNRP